MLFTLRQNGVDLPLASVVVWTSMLVVLVLLERVIPFETAWHQPDDQLVNDVAHTMLGSALGSQAGVFVADVFVAAVALALPTTSLALWTTGPGTLPLVAQVAVGFVVVDGARYAQHRLSHRLGFLWETHKLHHDPRRLLAIKAGRSHVLDRAMQALCVVPLVVLGANADVVFWCVAVNSTIGLIAHANIDAPSSGWIFVGPSQHRVHHAREARLHNSNFGAALTLWDRLFGTFRSDEVRNVGLEENTPTSVVAQLAAPVHAWLDR